MLLLDPFSILCHLLPQTFVLLPADVLLSSGNPVLWCFVVDLFSWLVVSVCTVLLFPVCGGDLWVLFSFVIVFAVGLLFLVDAPSGFGSFVFSVLVSLVLWCAGLGPRC